MNHAQYNLTLHFMAAEPVAAARRLELIGPEYAAEIVKGAPLEPAINVLKSMLPSVAAKLFMYFTEAQCLRLTESMQIADLAAILRHVPDDKRQATIALLPQRKQTLCKMLINYPEHTIGAMLETDVFVVDHKMPVADALTRLKKRSYTFLQWVYVVNQSRQLVGCLFIGDLLQAENQAEVGTLIKGSVEVVSASTDLMTAKDWGLWSHTDSVAVANRKQEFIGVLHQHRLRHFLAIKQTSETTNESFSADLIEIYGDTIASMVDLIQPLDKPA